MAKKREMQYRTHLRGHTSLSPDEVFDLAETIAADVAAGGIKLKPGSVSKDGTELNIEMRSTGMAYAFRGISAAGQQGGVTVFVGPEGARVPAGRRPVLVHLADAMTSHTSVMFVPVTPKKIIGFDTYMAFLDEFGAELSTRDSGAELEVSSEPAA